MDKMHYKYEVIARLAQAMEDVMDSFESQCRDYDQRAEESRNQGEDCSWYQDCADEYRTKYTLSKSLIQKMLDKI